MAIEEPRFEVVQQHPSGRLELRRYPGFVVAETEVTGGFDEASRSGFRRVAGYIFGGNQSGSGESQKIAMTAPVTVEPKPEGWRLHFVMPSGMDLNTLPKPTDPSVRIRAVGEHHMAAIRFSGFTTETAVAEKTAELEAWVTERGWQRMGNAQVARYNDPFTLPWNRRNEILIPVAP
ncbi:SOUL haem-binding protein [Burkholderiales bacterium]|jgi:hypothetical protein